MIVTFALTAISVIHNGRICKSLNSSSRVTNSMNENHGRFLAKDLFFSQGLRYNSFQFVICKHLIPAKTLESA